MIEKWCGITCDPGGQSTYDKEEETCKCAIIENGSWLWYQSYDQISMNYQKQWLSSIKNSHFWSQAKFKLSQAAKAHF